MKIQRIEFVGSFGSLQALPRSDRPEVAFFGRSNVGKSSVINSISGSRIALASKYPGRTGNVNCFLINGKVLFLDMPGYGYARVSREERARWRRLVEGYLLERKARKSIVYILDVRRDPGEGDREMVIMVEIAVGRFCLVFNKTDKIRNSELEDRIARCLSGLLVGGQVAVIPFSCRTMVGRRELLDWIGGAISL